MRQPVMVELFAGSAVMAAEFRRAGYRTITVDNDARTQPDIVADILGLTHDNPFMRLSKNGIRARLPEELCREISEVCRSST